MSGTVKTPGQPASGSVGSARRTLPVRVGIVGALGYAVTALVEAIVPRAGSVSAVSSIASSASATLVIGVVVGLIRSGIPWGRPARTGLWLVGVSWAMVGVAELVSLVRGEDTALLYVSATLLHVVGMVPVAIAAARKATTSGGLRWWPLICLLYLIVAMPAFGQPGLVAELALAGWGTAWLILAVRVSGAP